MVKKIFISLLVLGLNLMAFSQKFTFKPFEFHGDCDAFIKYRLLIPADTSQPKPLIVFLHGAGERGSDNRKQLTYIDTIFASGWFQSKYPSFVLAPQCPTGQKWVNVDWSRPSMKQPDEPGQSMFALMQLLRQIVKKYPIDTTRIYVIGLSMGGFGVWDLLYRMPHFFAAGVPICGGADTAIAKKIAHIPIWVFHGAKDNVVPVTLSRNMVKALRKYGANPVYTEYPNVKHGAWFKALSNRQLYQWLFNQKNTNFKLY